MAGLGHLKVFHAAEPPVRRGPSPALAAPYYSAANGSPSLGLQRLLHRPEEEGLKLPGLSALKVHPLA